MSKTKNIKKFRPHGMKPKERECLKCGRMFKSSGICNRICYNCNETNLVHRGGIE